MLSLYHFLTRHSAPVLEGLLKRRLAAGKEVPERLDERKGQTERTRPEGPLAWVHAASVGEAQSALIIIHQLLLRYPALQVLVTTGTRTSAETMEKSLPARAFHQFYPLDHPEWTHDFLETWTPDVILWLESELWPNMLAHIQARTIPFILINARLSERSFRRWRIFKPVISSLLKTFSLVLCQSEQDAKSFKTLGATEITVTGNLKYAAAPLPADDPALKALQGALLGRPCWLYASTHKGEELLAARIHQTLKNALPDLLTIIVPRHPERRDDLRKDLAPSGLNIIWRSTDKALPDAQTDLYIADTMGELGLFYRLAPIACIGRTFSDDGGGGHNPIEAAQLHCAVLHGPQTQNLQDIFSEMDEQGAALCVQNESDLAQTLHRFLTTPESLEKQQERAKEFTDRKKSVIHTILDKLASILDTIHALDHAS